MQDSAKKIYRFNFDDPELEQKLNALNAQLVASAPEHIRRLGRILRRGSLFFFKNYLAERGILHKIPKEMVPLFMDYLIVKRLDLADLAAESRTRLRDAMLEDQPEDCKTEDYVRYVEKATNPPSCKACRWFVQAPAEGEASCVALGSKGADFPCYGFILNTM